MTSPFRVSATASRVDVFFDRQPFVRRFWLDVRTIGPSAGLWLSLLAFVALIFAAVALVGGGMSRGIVVGLVYVLVSLVALGAILTGGGALLRALLPSASDALLPRRIGFRQDGIEVESAAGAVTQQRYAWLAGARRAGTGVELSLAHDRPIFVRITPASTGQEAFAKLCAWLQDHGVLGMDRSTDEQSRSAS
jgi:hypothetical protein